jgi:hypothetical protein
VQEATFADIERPSNAAEVLDEVLAWSTSDAMNERLLVADSRLRPTVPKVFKDEEEYCKTFVGFMLEEIREELAQSIRLPDLKKAMRVPRSATTGRVCVRLREAKLSELEHPSLEQSVIALVALAGRQEWKASFAQAGGRLSPQTSAAELEAE